MLDLLGNTICVLRVQWKQYLVQNDPTHDCNQIKKSDLCAISATLLPQTHARVTLVKNALSNLSCAEDPTPVRTPPSPTGHLSKNAIFLLFVRVRNVKNTTQVPKFAPCPCPSHLPPRHRSPWTPRPSPNLEPRGLPTPCLELPLPTQVPKLAPSLGPVPLPPTPPGTEALGSAPRALVPPTGHPSKNVIFLVFEGVETSKMRNFAPSWAP